MDTISICKGANITKIRLEHAWVEAYIPYANYRGNIRSEGGFAWIPLDPSFKQYEYHKPVVNLTEAMEMNASEFLNGIMDQSVINESASYITSMNQSYIQEQMEGYTNNTLDYLEANNLTNATLNDILGHRTIIKEELGILPNSLPYMSSKLAAYSEAPDALRHKIKFEIYGNATTLAMPELAGKRITLSYLPATEDDAALIEEYGGITEVPAYLVEMTPVLRVEGEAVAIGASETLGERQQFVMEFQMPGGSVDRVANDVTVGAYYAVGLDLGKVPLRLIEERKAKLATWMNLIDSTYVSGDDIVGEMLYITAISYFSELDSFSDISAKSKIVWTRQPSEAIVSLGLTVTYLFWSPYNVKASGMGIDVDRNIYTLFSTTGNQNESRAFILSTGTLGSVLESGIFEQLHGADSVSAIKIIQLASERGIPVYTINSTNINDILPKLKVSDAVKTGIQNAVSTGMIVTIPERNIDYYNWTGIGYIVIDPKTGAGAYMISGGTAGGETADLGSIWDYLGILDDLAQAYYKGKGLENLAKWSSRFGNLLIGIGVIVSFIGDLTSGDTELAFEMLFVNIALGIILDVLAYQLFTAMFALAFTGIGFIMVLVLTVLLAITLILIMSMIRYMIRSWREER